MLWSDNNENCDGKDWDDANMKNMPLQYRVYRPASDELDSNRPFIPGRPYGGIKNVDLLSESDLADYNSDIIGYHIKNNKYFTEAGMLSVHDRSKKNAEIIVGTNVSDRYEQLYCLTYIQYEWARFMLWGGMRRSKLYSTGIAYWMYNDCWPALGYAVVDCYGNPKSGWYATRYSGCPIAATVKSSGSNLEFIVLNDSFESKTLTYKIKAYRPETEIIELNVGTVHSQANVNVCAAMINQNENDIETSVIFFELYDGETLVSRAR